VYEEDWGKFLLQKTSTKKIIMFHTTTDCTQLFWKKHCVYQFSDLTLVRMKNIGANFHCKKRVLKKLLRFTQQLNARNCFGKSIVTNV